LANGIGSALNAVAFLVLKLDADCFPQGDPLHDTECDFAQALSLGFDGSLSTVSTWISELVDLYHSRDNVVKQLLRKEQPDLGLLKTSPKNFVLSSAHREYSMSTSHQRKSGRHTRHQAPEIPGRTDAGKTGETQVQVSRNDSLLMSPIGEAGELEDISVNLVSAHYYAGLTLLLCQALATVLNMVEGIMHPPFRN
jgi:hypothetical protein